MGGIDKLRKHQPFIQRLGATKGGRERRELIKSARPEQLKCIAGVAYNTLKGAIPLTKSQKRYVLKHRNQLHKFVNSCCSVTIGKKDCVHVKPKGVAQIRRQLSQQSGGIFPFIIPLLTLAGKAILGGAIAAGSGAVVKKIVG